METIVKEIINSGYKGSLIITGGGTEAISMLTRYGGASKFLVEAQVPYSVRSLSFFKQNNKASVSPETALDMANAAVHYSTTEKDEYTNNFIGLGCTSKLTYEGERKNREHMAYIGIVINKLNSHFKSGQTFEVKFPKGTIREEQERRLSVCILNCLLYGVGKAKTAGLKMVST